MILRSVITTTLFFSSCFSTLAQDSFRSVDAFLKATLKQGEELGESAKGDLNGDATEDWVGVIYSRPEDGAPTYQLFVLTRADGGYRVAAQTEKAEIAGMGCCWLEDLTIRQGSIYIQNNAKTAATMEAATHQFKWYKGEWRLLGVKIYFTDHTPGAESTTDTDMNVLTGLVIEKAQKGNKRPVTTRR
ncbi:MAG TPA: hypothetical protein VJV03_18515, partial [Pyrinomonadaceae bacterium]|nr:hypothetical protein [Pyrinomonadaceae bacterium]